MYNPWTPYFRFQQSFLESAAGMARLMTESYLRLLRQQQEAFFRSLDQRRAEDLHIRPRALAKGPELADHYGRRARDIDVEKDV
jgi:hypothetical protein